jgi:histidine ammonia-lyase
VIAVLRAHGVHGPGPDRHLSPEIEAAVELVRSGAVLDAVETAIGALG